MSSRDLTLAALFVILAIHPTTGVPGRDVGAPRLARGHLDLLDPGEGCRRVLPVPGILRMNAHFIAPPRGDRAAWLAAMRDYRAAVRNGWPGESLEVDFDGVRAWARLSLDASRALDLAPGDEMGLTVEARRLEGPGLLCAAFDIHDRATGAKVGWSTVRGTLRFADDGAWHRVEGSIRVPAFDRGKVFLRPIFGRDATHDATRARFDIRSLEIAAPGSAGLDRFLSRLPPPGLDRSIYDRPDFAWASRAFVCHFTFLYDSSVLDPLTGQFAIDSFLDEGERAFGGYDCLLLWQGYPRLGVDPRNQFDVYRDLPGGLEGLRRLVRRCHERGVKVSIDYNPWDTGTRREGRPDEEALADLVAAIDADAIFLDTMTAGSRRLREAVDAARPGVVFAPEGHPEIGQLAISSASWAQWLEDPDPPGVLHLKWVEPRHMQYQIRRWDRSHRGEVETAFFNGSGVLVWENIFGTFNPWPEEDRRTLRRAVRLLRLFAEEFTSDSWEPHVPTLAPGLFASSWPGSGVTVITLLNRSGAPIRDAPLLAVGSPAGLVWHDAWNDRPVAAAPGAGPVIRGSVDRVACLVSVERSRAAEILGAIHALGHPTAEPRGPADPGTTARSVVDPRPVERTRPAPRGAPPAGMVLVPVGRVTLEIEHMRRECGCYPDPGTPVDRHAEFLWGEPHDGRIRHRIGPVEVRPFFIDECEVSNAEFRRFLDATGWRPTCSWAFLRHWPDGKMPVELADHPVVWVDLEDARAYARWAGKRLPTEVEWQLAAQGTDGRKWPWGTEFEGTRCNVTGTGTLPVRSIPEGRSPYGCYHMSGNVWEWTESERDDGHTRFAIIRGGSWFDAVGSIWYVRGGPQPCDSHAKMLLLWPGLDRCSTLGFRCVVDVEGS